MSMLFAAIIDENNKVGPHQRYDDSDKGENLVHFWEHHSGACTAAKCCSR